MWMRVWEFIFPLKCSCTKYIECNSVNWQWRFSQWAELFEFYLALSLSLYRMKTFIFVTATHIQIYIFPTEFQQAKYQTSHCVEFTLHTLIFFYLFLDANWLKNNKTFAWKRIFSSISLSLCMWEEFLLRLASVSHIETGLLFYVCVCNAHT